MIQANWDIFNAKFTNGKEKAFEWLCYLLFCRKYNKPEGLPAYLNQSGIETDPINYGSDVIGWQAKYYSNTLSKESKKIEKTLEDIRKNYPNLTTLIFYTNSEWAQSNGKVPKGKITTESLAKKLNIKIEWHTKSFFDSDFVCIQNADIASFFFEQKCILEDIHKNVQFHNNSILQSIKNTISYNGLKYKIDRTPFFSSINNSGKDLIVISGEAGVGKSAIIKDYLEKDNVPFILIKAVELENPSNNLQQLFRHLQDYVQIFSNEKRKFFILDSAEKLIYLPDPALISYLLKTFTQNGWKIIITTRKTYCDSVTRLLNDFWDKFDIENVDVGEISDDSLINILSNFKKGIPSDLRLHNFIKNPFYLNKYIHSTNSSSFNNFKGSLWKDSLKNYGSEFIELVVNNLKEGHVYLENINSSCCQFLQEQNIIAQDQNGYYIAQDIYEDLALEKFINQKFCNTGVKCFFDNFPCKYPFVKAFRKWFLGRIDEEPTIINNFLELNNIIEPNLYTDEILCAVLMSKNAPDIFDRYHNELLDEKNNLLKRISKILFVRCRILDFEMCKLFGNPSTPENVEIYFTKPIGSGWFYYFKFIYENLNSLGNEWIEYTIPLMKNWNSSYKTGKETAVVNKIALKIYDDITNDITNISKKNEEKIFEIISNGSAEESVDIKKVLDRIINNNHQSISRIDESFAEYILKSPTPGSLFKTHSDEILEIAQKFWIRKEDDENWHHYDADYFYGLDDSWSHSYNAVSAMQTPFLSLLYAYPDKTIDWIIRFVNFCAESYHTSDFGKQSQILIFKFKSLALHQIADTDLWEMYRGIGGRVKPDILTCLHMALEYYLLRNVDINCELIKKDLYYILENTKSISLTAVVSSVVMAYPDKFYDIAFELFRNKECFLLDNYRLNRENIPVQYSDIDRFPMQFNERKKSNTLPHRKNSLVDLCLSYQILEYKGKPKNFKKEIIDLIDSYYAEKDSNELWHAILQKIDSRKNKISIKVDNNNVYMQSQTEFDDRSKAYSKQTEANCSSLFTHSELSEWATKTWKQEPLKKSKYSDISIICEEIKTIGQELQEKGLYYTPIYHYNDTLTLAICCLVRDNWNMLLPNDKQFCHDVIKEYTLKPFYLGYSYQVGDGTNNAIQALGYLSIFDDNNADEWIYILLCTLFRYGDEGELYKINSRKALANLHSVNRDISIQLVQCFIFLTHSWNTFLFSRQAFHSKDDGPYLCFFKQNESTIESFLDYKQSLPSDWTWNEYTLKDFIPILYLLGLVSIDTSLIKSAVKKSFELFKESYNHYEYDYPRAMANLAMRLPSNHFVSIFEPIVKNYDASEFYSDFLKNLIYEECELQQPDKFWVIWNVFKPHIISYHNAEKNDNNKKEILYTYLFGLIRTSKEWNIFFKNEKIDNFISDLCNGLNQTDCLLFPLCSLLYRLIPQNLPQNIENLHKCIQSKNSRYYDDNAVISLEYAMKMYAHKFRSDFIRNNPKKTMFIDLLDFLIENECISAYYMKEDFM